MSSTVHTSSVEMKTCRKCKETLPIDMFYTRRLDCKPCYLEEKREKYDPKVGADKHLRQKYGITLDQYDDMLSDQGGVCAICGEYNVDRKDTHLRMPVDHCHKTGKVRGILCNRCNLVLGKVEDSIELLSKAINYLS